MLQAFALDDIYCPTGFFTLRYAIVDISDTVEVYLVLPSISLNMNIILTPAFISSLGWILCRPSYRSDSTEHYSAYESDY